MNRLRYIILWLGTALLASCSADMESEAQPSEQQAIQLTAQGLSAMVPTRAASTSDLQNTAFAAGEDVAVYVENHSSENTYNATPYCFRASAAVGGQNELTYYNNVTTASRPCYPVSASEGIDIYGFYPYSKFSAVNNRSTTDLDVSVYADQSTAANYRSSDIMMATAITDQKRTTDAVVLQFRHLLAKLVIRLKQGVHSGTSSVVSATHLANSTLTIGSVKTNATLNMGTGDVTTDNNDSGTTVTIATSSDLAFYYNNATATISTTEYAIILPPQSLGSDNTITITTSAGTISGTLPDLSLSAGSSTVLTLTINDYGIEASRSNYGNGGSTTWQ